MMSGTDWSKTGISAGIVATMCMALPLVADTVTYTGTSTQHYNDPTAWSVQEVPHGGNDYEIASGELRSPTSAADGVFNGNKTNDVANFSLELRGLANSPASAFSLDAVTEDGQSTLYLVKTAWESVDKNVVAATWTGAGLDNAISTAGNWLEGLPDFTTGETDMFT